MSTPLTDRFDTVVWQYLMLSLYGFKRRIVKNGQDSPDADSVSDSEILIISPWISDIENKKMKLRLPLADMVSQVVGREMKSLTILLIELARAGAKVGLMTAPLDHPYKRDFNEYQKSKEREMLERLSKRGVQIRLSETNHAKIISTPVGVMSGSANITDNGFYKNTEMMTLVPRKEGGFGSFRERSTDIWYEGRQSFIRP